MPAHHRPARRTVGAMRCRLLLSLFAIASLIFGLGTVAAAQAVTRSLPSGRTTFRHLAQYDADIDELVAARPDLARRITLTASSTEGRRIPVVEISAGVDRRDDGRPTFIVTGLTHAREWASGEVAMEFAQDLALRYGRDRTITRLLRRVRIVVVPVVNPDGFVVSRDGLTAKAKAHRTNCAVADAAEAAQPCALRSGVDLNRNGGFAWGGAGASAQLGSELYRGPAPWSEPESQAIHALMAGRQLTGMVALHSFGGQVLRQPGFRGFGTLPDERRQARLGRAMAAAAGYSSERADALYDATGAQEDWSYVAQDALAYTIELGGAGFQGAHTSLVTDQYFGHPRGGGGVRAALLLAASAAADPAGHAVISGIAPGVRILKLERSFVTQTSPVCTAGFTLDPCPSPMAPTSLADGVHSEMVVPFNGIVRWDVAPSTGPQDERAGRHTSWTLRCEAPEGFLLREQTVTIARGQRRNLGDLCR